MSTAGTASKLLGPAKPFILRTGRLLGIDLAALVGKQSKNTAPRMLADREFRREVIVSDIESLNGPIMAKAQGIIRVATVWESSKRLIWLSYAADKDPECEVLHIPRTRIFDRVFVHMFTEYAESIRQRALGESNLGMYYTGDFSSQRDRFREYCQGVMSFIRDQYDVDVWFLPKLTDAWITDLVMALKRTGRPIIVNDREGQMSPKRLEVYPNTVRRYVKDFEVDLICVQNEMQREFFERCGIDPSRITITGKPDADYWHRPDLWQSREQIDPRLREDRFVILFFSFGPRTYLDFYFGNDERTWDYLGTDYHEVLLNLLKKYPGKIQIVYKTSPKAARDRFSQYNRFLEEAATFADENSILNLGKQYSSLDLIRNADVVLGFQTTGLTEPMFTDKPIVFGAWGDFYEEIKDALLPYHKTGALIHVRSKEEMQKCLESLIEGRDEYRVTEVMKAIRKEFRETYYYNPDGNVSRRVLDEAKKLARQTR